MAARPAIHNIVRIALIIACCTGLCACGGGGGGGGPTPTTRLTLTGLVRSAAAAPLAEVHVLMGSSTATTGADGSFQFTNLLAGRYTLSLQDAAGHFDCRSIDLQDGATDFTFTLPAADGGLFATQVEPALSATGASLNGPLQITFNAPLDAASVSAADFTTTPALGTLTPVVSGAVLELRPNLQLPANQNILVELTGALASDTGTVYSKPLRWRFRTAASDSFPPLLIETQPVEGSTGFAPNMSVIFSFGEALLVDNPALSAVGDPAAELITAVNGRSVLVDAPGGWQINTPYTITLSGVADKLGNVSPDSFTLHFTTGAEPAPHFDLQPEWNRVLDRIVFASNRFGGYDIFSIRSDGTGLIQLTALPGDELHPSLSNDGALLCYQKLGDGGDWDIFVRQLDSADAIPATASGANDYEPVFSRTDSRDIFFTSDRNGSAGLYSMHSDGSSLTQLDREASGGQSQPAPHPLLDRQLLYMAQSGDNLSIWRKTISATDGSVVNLELTSGLSSDERAPCWSPDASLVGFISDIGGVFNLWVTDAAGVFPRQVTFFTQPADDPSMAPSSNDGRCVLSLRNSSGGSRLVIVDLVSGDILTELTGGGDGN